MLVGYESNERSRHRSMTRAIQYTTRTIEMAAVVPSANGIGSAASDGMSREGSGFTS